MGKSGRYDVKAGETMIDYERRMASIRARPKMPCDMPSPEVKRQEKEFLNRENYRREMKRRALWRLILWGFEAGDTVTARAVVDKAEEQDLQGGKLRLGECTVSMKQMDEEGYLALMQRKFSREPFRYMRSQKVYEEGDEPKLLVKEIK